MCLLAALALPEAAALPVAAQEEPVHRALAEELVGLLEADRGIQNSMEAMKEVQLAQIRAMGLAGEDTRRALEVQERLMDALAEELDWGRVRQGYVDVYAAMFTREELEDIIDFYRSETGRKFIERMPELVSRSMELSQEFMAEVMPRLEDITREMMEEYARRPRSGL